MKLKKLCENCNKKTSKLTKFRSIMVCGKCEELLDKESESERGTNLEDYEEYDSEDGVVPNKKYFKENPKSKSSNPTAEIFASQIKKGILVETEHTDNLDVALKIATDHLKEIPNYYDELEKMESKVKKNPVLTNEDFHNGKEKKGMSLIDGIAFIQKIDKIKKERDKERPEKNNPKGRNYKLSNPLKLGWKIVNISDNRVDVLYGNNFSDADQFVKFICKRKKGNQWVCPEMDLEGETLKDCINSLIEVFEDLISNEMEK